jgi:putative SOS response-associated peptidase YedK
MCGRFSLTKTEKELEERFKARFYTEDLERYQVYDNYNVAPTHVMPVVLHDEMRALRMFRWGLIPFWSKDHKIGAKMINARSETISEKATFKKLLSNKRCIIPMNGYFEWQREGKTKKPFFIHRQDQTIMAACGLWEQWKNPENNELVRTFSIITRPAANKVTHIHDRMPMFISAEMEDWWLSDGIMTQDDVNAISELNFEDALDCYPVTDRVNKVQNNDPELIKPLPENPTLF